MTPAISEHLAQHAGETTLAVMHGAISDADSW